MVIKNARDKNKSLRPALSRNLIEELCERCPFHAKVHEKQNQAMLHIRGMKVACLQSSIGWKGKNLSREILVSSQLYFYFYYKFKIKEGM
jgi:hypothetical protein